MKERKEELRGPDITTGTKRVNHRSLCSDFCRRDGCLTTVSVRSTIIRYTVHGFIYKGLDVVPMLSAEQQPGRELLIVIQRSHAFRS